MKEYATSQQVAGSITDEVIGFFSSPNSSSRTMGLRSAQSLTELGTKNIPAGKIAADAYG
jgi:hypothetical protein